MWADYNGKRIPAKFVVVDNQGAGCLLGHDSAIQLGLLHVDNTVNNVSPEIDSNNLRAKFPQVLDGVAKLKDYQQTIHVDPSIAPVAQPPRHISSCYQIRWATTSGHH